MQIFLTYKRGDRKLFIVTFIDPKSKTRQKLFISPFLRQYFIRFEQQRVAVWPSGNNVPASKFLPTNARKLVIFEYPH